MGSMLTLGYVIINDRTDFTDKQQEHFVHVDPMWRITDEHVIKTINILNYERDKNSNSCRM